MGQRYLVLKNGSVYSGVGFGSKKAVHAELVFSTGMTGYQETLTDASYRGQMITFTYPMIGNYGINKDDFESLKPAASGIIAHEIARRPSNFRSQMSLASYAEKNDLPGISGVDTRALTKELRDYGTMEAVIVDDLDQNVIAQMFAIPLPTNEVEKISTKTIYQAPTDGISIAVIDFGIKNSILRALAKRGINITVFPASVDAKTVLDANPDGVLLSNGPGDPQDVTYALPTIKALQAELPLMGICLGHQLFALANGANTYKMKFGHRGFNHAVRDLSKAYACFTSQNHGYAVDAASLAGTDLEVTHIEVNDQTVEGLRLKNHAAISVQFHPDAAPGPHDAEYIFDDFISMIKAVKEGGK